MQKKNKKKTACQFLHKIERKIVIPKNIQLALMEMYIKVDHKKKSLKSRITSEKQMKKQ